MADIDMNPAKQSNNLDNTNHPVPILHPAESASTHESSPLLDAAPTGNAEVSVLDRPSSPRHPTAEHSMEPSLHLRDDDEPTSHAISENSPHSMPVFHDGDVQPVAPERTLNVTDALSYLDSVKMRFQDNPDVYNRFLDIMKDFKSQLIDTPGVIERVSNLFHGHLELIQGFNTFLPAGYRIECISDAQNPNYITVITPAGTTTQATDGVFAFGNPVHQFGARPIDATLLSNTIAQKEGEFSTDPVPEVFQPAMSFVARVKKRYQNDPERYRQFLETLSDKSTLSPNDNDILQRIGKLFFDAPDLMKVFEEFLPGKLMQELQLARAVASSDLRAGTPTNEGKGSKKRGEGSTTTGTSLPQKRKRKPVEREKEKETSKAGSSKVKKVRSQATVQEVPSPALSHRHAAGPSSPRRSSHSQNHGHHHAPALPPPIPVPTPHAPAPLAANDDAQFFDRVKRALDNRETYNEFLKLVNLFTQDIIDRTQLVRESRSFLGDTELMAQFKDILGWDEQNERYAGVEDVWSRPIATLDRPSRNQLNIRYGSYRKLPANEAKVLCAGRDDMCRSVLNDEWISHPTFASEDAGFLTHKKNVYEEALHRSEEERHEYDFHIEAIHRTIQMLEPLSNKIAQLNPDERNAFKLKPNLGGVAKSIHQRVIKKIYGRELGVEVYQLMQETPALAIPVVLTRLKQKHEEWKRAQREWNKVWREVDARNYHKSLDHQGITFKATDKKAITPKAFVNQIETARGEQMAKRAALIEPLFARTRPRHQLEFVIEDVAVLQDALKLTLSFLDRTQAQIVLADRRKIEIFLRAFVPLFFALEPVAFNAFVPLHETVDSDMETESAVDDAELASASGSSRAGRNRKAAGAGSAGDLRKRLLKSEQAKSSRRTRARDGVSPASRLVSPTNPDATADERRSPVGTSSESASAERLPARRRYSFFTNTTFYVLFRLLEVLYTRLHIFRGLTTKLASESTALRKPNSLAVDMRAAVSLLGLDDKSANAAHFYDLMLDSCEKLFDNEIEPHVFEDQLRYMFGAKNAYKMFTVDKVVGALIKQVQAVLLDAKSQELFDLLHRERELVATTTQDQQNLRRNTEKVLGPDENLFRMDWLTDSKTVTVQLLGKDDSSFDDSEVLTGRWHAYVDSFVSHGNTEGVELPASRMPFLRKTRLPSADRSADPPTILARGGLEIKVCVRTYRLFYVSRTEDVLFRVPTRAEREAALHKLDARVARRKKWIEKMTAKDTGTGAVASVVPDGASAPVVAT
ncbi:hypothetical protein B0H21DRAFT_490302 [Amylocystis lapponica]|nr:hypothetical protein B0H21DRAFT_490302 [Amylocystis lapponica]